MTNAEAIHVINQVMNVIAKNPSWMEEATRVVNEAADMAIKALEAQEWIPCSERLPDEDHRLGDSGRQFSDMVLVSITNREDEEAWCDISLTIDGEWELGLPKYCKITAWRNLPEPYREDGDYMDEERFKRECEEVKRLGDQIGYGNMMTIASALWAKMLIDKGWKDIGAFYPTILSNMKPGDLTVYAMKERTTYLQLFKKWEDTDE